MSRKMRDLSGQKFGMLTVETMLIARPASKKSYLCRCDCGNTCVRIESSLTSKSNKERVHSCGCYKKKFLVYGDAERCSKAGVARAKLNVNGCNTLVTFKDGLSRNNTSGVQGVSWDSHTGKYCVRIGYKNYYPYLGSYEDLSVASMIRKKAEDAIKENFFEDFFYELRGKRLEEYMKHTN